MHVICHQKLAQKAPRDVRAICEAPTSTGRSASASMRRSHRSRACHAFGNEGFYLIHLRFSSEAPEFRSNSELRTPPTCPKTPDLAIVGATFAPHDLSHHAQRSRLRLFAPSELQNAVEIHSEGFYARPSYLAITSSRWDTSRVSRLQASSPHSKKGFSSLGCPI